MDSKTLKRALAIYPGNGLTRTAKKLGVDRTTLARALRAVGFVMAPRGRPRGKHAGAVTRTATDKRRAYVLRAYSRGDTVQAIADHLGFTTGTIYGDLRKHARAGCAALER